MSKEFNIQRFAEDAADPSEVEEVTAEQTSEETVTPYAEQEEIPEELAFLDEPYRTEAVKEWKEMQTQSQESQPQAQEPPPTPSEPQPQPADEVTTLKNEVTALKAQLAQVLQQRQQPPAVNQPAQEPQQPPQPELTPEIVNKLKAAIDAEAYRMSGLTKEDIYSFEFADPDDERVTRWKNKKSYAIVKICAIIQLHHKRQAANPSPRRGAIV